MKYLFSLLLLCQIIGLSAKERVDSILSVLDSEIEHREIYYQQKEKKLENIKQQFRYVKKSIIFATVCLMNISLINTIQLTPTPYKQRKYHTA
jgi:hypothetical protein